MFVVGCVAGAVGVLDVIDAVSALLAAPGIPSGPVQLSLAGSSVDAGELSGQLAAALTSIAEKNEAAAAEAAAAEEEEEAPAVAKPAISLFGIATRKVRERRVARSYASKWQGVACCGFAA
jgi:hypothetical protein